MLSTAVTNSFGQYVENILDILKGINILKPTMERKIENK